MKQGHLHAMYAVPTGTKGQGYKVGLSTSLVVRLIGLLLVFASQKIAHRF